MKSGVETARSLAGLLVEPSARRLPPRNSAQEIMAQSGTGITKNATTMTSIMSRLTIMVSTEFHRGICHRQASAASGTRERHLAISRHPEAVVPSGIVYRRARGLYEDSTAACEIFLSSF
jgi:hypothetical protein